MSVFIGVFHNFHTPWIASNVKNSPEFIFSYPSGPLSIAGSKIPTPKENIFIHERFDKEYMSVAMNLYQFALYAKRYPMYMPTIERKLKAAWIPDDIKYLAIAESALRNDVVSKAGAAGIWQFMPATARDYGLVVNEYVDERYHVEKSTDAAIKYLQKLYALFDDWPLAMAAYNMGQWAVWRSLEAQGVKSYYDLYMNEETSRYVFRILGIKYAFEGYFPQKEAFHELYGEAYEPIETKTITVWKIDDLPKWSLEQGYNYQTIKYLNRWIVKSSLPKGTWSIAVPK